MMLLLDTHTLLWAFYEPERLPAGTRKVFLASQNQLFCSIASIWEISIKLALGKLKLGSAGMKGLKSELSTNRIQLLPIEFLHCEILSDLPFHHRDPFDRLLAAQALALEVPIISTDPIFEKYGIKRQW